MADRRALTSRKASHNTGMIRATTVRRGAALAFNKALRSL